MRAALANLDKGEFTEGHELDRKWKVANPTVIVTSHPVKHFSRENMLPRGGGAFLNEMDGNLTCMKVDGTMVTELHWQGKFRGIDFAAIPFRLEVGKTDKLKDSKGDTYGL